MLHVPGIAAVDDSLPFARDVGAGGSEVTRTRGVGLPVRGKARGEGAARTVGHEHPCLSVADSGRGPDLHVDSFSLGSSFRVDLRHRQGRHPSGYPFQPDLFSSGAPRFGRGERPTDPITLDRAPYIAHGVTGTGPRFGKRPEVRDHWHRTEDDPGRPYRFTDAETLIDDFFAEVEHTLRERGIGTTVIAVEEDDS